LLLGPGFLIFLLGVHGLRLEIVIPSEGLLKGFDWQTDIACCALGHPGIKCSTFLLNYLPYLRMYLFTYLLTYLVTHLLTYLLTYLLTHLLTYSLTYSLTHSFTHSLTHSLTSVPTYLLTHSLIYILTHSLTNLLLTSWSRVLLEKLTSSELVKKFPTFYGTGRFITTFSTVSFITHDAPIYTSFLTLQRGAFKSQFKKKWQFCTFVFFHAN
jgi:hypothetical protein